MIRTARSWAALLGVTVACGEIAKVDDTPCIPAPFRGRTDWSCTGNPVCTYVAPRNYGLTTEDPINALKCQCFEGSWICESNLAGLVPPPRPICPSDMVEGTSCEWIDAGAPGTRTRNAECLVLGPNADLDAGVIDGKACACDYPGPTWRCVPVDTLKYR